MDQINVINLLDLIDDRKIIITNLHTQIIQGATINEIDGDLIGSILVNKRESNFAEVIRLTGITIRTSNTITHTNNRNNSFHTNNPFFKEASTS